MVPHMQSSLRVCTLECFSFVSVVGAYGGHKNSTFYVKSTVSPEGKWVSLHHCWTFMQCFSYRYLLSGSSCSRVFIWYLDEPHQPPTVLNGHSKEVTAVCWSPALTEVIPTHSCTQKNSNTHLVLVNPRRTCAVRVTVLGLSFRPYVCLLPRFLPPRATRQQNSDTNSFISTLAWFYNRDFHRSAVLWHENQLTTWTSQNAN